MTGIHSFYLFWIASLLLNITPGSDMLYVATRSASQGFRAGVVSALGIFTGCLVHILAAIFGLSALLAQSATAFEVVKYAGAAYLAHLGIRSLLSKASSAPEVADAPRQKLLDLYTKGILTNVLNPKVALFSLAFLPQFADPASPDFGRQVLFLGLWFDVQGTLIVILVAAFFGRLGQWLRQSPRFWRVQEKVTGAILLLLGVRLALMSRK